MQATRVQPREKPRVGADPQLEENRRLRRQWAHDPSVRLLLDADSAIRRIAWGTAQGITRLFGR